MFEAKWSILAKSYSMIRERRGGEPSHLSAIISTFLFYPARRVSVSVFGQSVITCITIIGASSGREEQRQAEETQNSSSEGDDDANRGYELWVGRPLISCLRITFNGNRQTILFLFPSCSIFPLSCACCE